MPAARLPVEDLAAAGAAEVVQGARDLKVPGTAAGAALRAFRGLRERTLDLKALRGQTLVLRAIRDFKGFRVSREILDLRDSKGFKALEGFRVFKDSRALEFRALKVFRGFLGIKAIKVLR